MSLAERLLQTEPQRFGLWPSVWKLLRLRVRIWWNIFRHAKTRSKIGRGVVMLLLLGLMGFMFFASSLLLRFLRSPKLAQYIDPVQFLNVIPTLVLTAAFFVVLMTNFGVLLQALYLSRDMDFLVTTPLPMRAVFLSKLLEGVLPNFALFSAFSLPVLFGLGTASGYNLLYYPLLVVMLALLALAAGGLASILVMAVVRVVPAKRVAEVLGVLGAMASFLCGQSGNLMQAAGVKGTDMGNALNTFSRMDVPWSPLSWAGRGLTAIGHGEWLPGLALSLLSLALAGGIFAGTLILAERLYYTGWSSLQGSARRKRAPRPVLAPAAAVGATSASTLTPAGASLRGLPAAAAPVRVNPLVRLVPAPVRSVILKDLLLLRRDLRNLSNLITPVILGLVMLFTTRGGGRNTERAFAGLGLRNLEIYGLIALAIFVGWMLMMNLASLSFTREGRSYWMVKTSPIRPLHLMAGKFIVSYLPAALFSLVYLVLAFLIRQANLAFLPFAALVILLSMGGATGIAQAFGVAGANLDWDNVQRQRLTGTAGCVSFIAVAGFMLVDVILFLLPATLWQIFQGSTPLISYLLGIVMGTAAALAAVIVPLWLMMPRLARIGETE